jgi:AraC-like DNA-binding protein
MADVLRQAAIKGVPELLSELGVAPMPLLEKYGISLSAVDNPDSFFSYSRWAAMLNEAALATNCPHFGLLVSKSHTMSTLGMLGLAMQQSPDVKAALKTFERYFYLHTDAAKIINTVESNIYIGKYSIEVAGVENVKQVVDLSLGHGHNIFKFLCGSKVKPSGVYFMHGMPADVRPYKKMFDCPLHFNADYNALTYPAELLAKPMFRHSDEMHKALISHLSKLECNHPNDIKSQVAHSIRALLPTGKSGIELVAASMNMSKRTLQKRLQEKGTSYQKLLDIVRSDIAKQYLIGSNVSMTRLGNILAYSELSAFSRAFKRWFGVAPKNWQQ